MADGSVVVWRSANLISPVEVDSLNLTGTSYQLGKYIKHTIPPTGSGFVTVFEDPTYDNYRHYITINGTTHEPTISPSETLLSTLHGLGFQREVR